ncbi:MAG: hypothetical protein J6T36_04020 [Campylobacter sp.]|nr:hypothetical protein [Campylobacter sp.]
MNFDEVFSTEPQKPAEVPYADLKKKFYIAFGLMFLGGFLSVFVGNAAKLLILIGFGVKIFAVLQTKQIANSKSLLLNFIMSTVAVVVGLIVFALATGMALNSIVSGINISVLILYILSMLIFIASLVFSFRYYQEFADITDIRLFLYVFVLLLVGGIVEKLSPTLGGLINLVAVGLEIYAIYLITHIAKSAYNYKITGKERLSFAQERDESLEDLHRLNSNSREF